MNARRCHLLIALTAPLAVLGCVGPDPEIGEARQAITTPRECAPPEVIPIAATCSGTSQVCEPYAISTVFAPGDAHIVYETPNHCSAITVELFTGGVSAGSSGVLNAFESFAWDVNLADGGFELVATGIFGGCNGGTLGAWEGQVTIQSQNPKVLVCHNDHEICISDSAVQAHLDRHGDHLGACGG